MWFFKTDDAILFSDGKIIALVNYDDDDDDDDWFNHSFLNTRVGITKTVFGNSEIISSLFKRPGRRKTSSNSV